MRASVQLRLLAAFGVVVGLMLAVGLFSITRLRADDRHLNQISSQDVPSTRVVGDVNALLNKYRKDQVVYIVSKSAERSTGVPSGPNDLAADLAKMSAYLDGYRRQGLVEDPVDLRLFGLFRAHFARYIALSGSFARLADQGRSAEANAALGSGGADAQYDGLKADIAAWADHKLAAAATDVAASRSSYRSGVALILAMLAAAVAIAMLVALRMARRWTQAVREIGAAAKAISDGDIDQHVSVRSRDEFGAMAKDFDSMVEYLRSTVAVAESIAAGRLDIEVHPRSERDALGNSLAVMTESLQKLRSNNESLLAASHMEANTDGLTGLPNRRSLMRDVQVLVAEAIDDRQSMLGVFDLDGFKLYNDMFGHAAGDALLTRLAARLKRALEEDGRAYRMGGDEFCVVAQLADNNGAVIARRAARALSESGEGFTVGCSYGFASIPREAITVGDAIQIADQRMYAFKNSRASAGRQSADVLMRVLAERNPGLRLHTMQVAALARLTAEEMGVEKHEAERVELAAELHDIGKVAIPDSILEKPGPLNDQEWEFMRRHTEVGERIVIAAPSIAHTAGLVRSSHERWDGTGYPDKLAAADIPLGARIIAVCEAFHTMTSDRPCGEPRSITGAVAEIRGCSGTQFDPAVVTTFCGLIEDPEFAFRSLGSEPLTHA